MSFNIRYGTAPDGHQHWERRRALVIDRIRAFQPHLLGLQECRDDAQAEFIKQSLPEFQLIGVRRGGAGDPALEMAPVLYRRADFEELAHGYLWLSETPAIPASQSWGSAFARTATWVHLRHSASTQELFFLNTHFDYASEAARQQSAHLLQRWIKDSAQSWPSLLTGDFNASKDSDAYRILTQRGALQDVYRTLHPELTGDETFHGFGNPAEQASIDWILASGHFRPGEAAVDRSRDGGVYPSDHYPITAVLELSESPAHSTRITH